MPTVSFTEKELEDYFCKYVKDDWGCRVVTRQLKLNSGILDVLICDGTNFFVVELKKDEITPDAVVQALAYTLELRAKYPKHQIFPMVIGNSLKNGHLTHCLTVRENFCDHYEDGISYQLFGWDMENGLSFTWHDKSQYSKEKARHEMRREFYSKRRARISGENP